MMDSTKAHELFRYDPNSGDLIRRVNAAGNARAGDKVCRRNGNGYFRVTHNYKPYYVHRIIWLMVHGDWPPNEIDHVNQNRSDNRIENLRAVDHANNNHNQTLRNTNTSGIMGVNWSNQRNKWVVYIYTDARKKHLGYFIDFFEAVCARKSAENKFNFHPNHGRTA